MKDKVHHYKTARSNTRLTAWLGLVAGSLVAGHVLYLLSQTEEVHPFWLVYFLIAGVSWLGLIGGLFYTGYVWDRRWFDED